MVLTSPLQRAARTYALAGFASAAEIDRALLEWNYGQYEGRRTAEIHVERPDWDLFRDGCPGGESPDQVAARADDVLSRVRGARADVLVFPAATSCGCSPPAGSALHWRPRDTCC
jgi:broad specificity phosphatase PhoE